MGDGSEFQVNAKKSLIWYTPSLLPYNPAFSDLDPALKLMIPTGPASMTAQFPPQPPTPTRMHMNPAFLQGGVLGGGSQIMMGIVVDHQDYGDALDVDDPATDSIVLTTDVQKCNYWPNCRAGEECVFWHPKEVCR